MTQHLTFDDFYAKWGPGGTAAVHNERQGAQLHFADLCHLLDVPTPGNNLQDGENYCCLSKSRPCWAKYMTEIIRA